MVVPPVALFLPFLALPALVPLELNLVFLCCLCKLTVGITLTSHQVWGLGEPPPLLSCIGSMGVGLVTGSLLRWDVLPVDVPRRLSFDLFDSPFLAL